MGTNLEHLDESNTEVQVCQVSTNQTQAEEQPNGNNGTQVDASSHLDSLAPIKKVCIAREKLGHDCRKSQVVGGQDDRVVCLVLVLVLTIFHHNIVGALRNFSVSRIHLLNKITEELTLIQVLQKANN